ncbi:MAG: hypothetical protein M1520_01160, partial [Candidatus Marsarchaeota archaeon]|nr:hypothetical protein [Candidatus Marsarchaeota archaeon]
MQRIVIPGEKLSDTAVRMHNTLVHQGKTYSTIVGLYNDEKNILIPMEGLWHPAYGDLEVLSRMRVFCYYCFGHAVTVICILLSSPLK